MELLIY
jgi:dTDP-glucose 4,6-dehydratase